MMDDFSFEPSRKVKMFLWAGMEMGRGFMWALAITTVIILGLVALRFVAIYLLPDASQEGPQPMTLISQPVDTAAV
jgi:hypothetical protein